MIFSPQAPTVLSTLVVVFASIGVVAVIFLLIATIVYLFDEWRERKIQEFRDQINAAQKALLLIEKERDDCQLKVCRLSTYKDSLSRTISELNAAIELKRQTCRQYEEDIQNLAGKVKDLDAAIKQKEDKLYKVVMVEIEIGSEKRRVSI